MAVIGAGLTGLTSAYVLHQAGLPVTVFEAEDVIGGASRTVEVEGFRFDLGGHRFYTRNEAVLEVVRQLLGDDLLSVPRRSSIHLRGKLVEYPLRFSSALAALGPLASVGVGWSYVWEKAKGLARRPPEDTFEDWVVRRFGRKLYDIYFRPYSEKVWGVPCTELTADFAAQRIRGLSLRAAIRGMFVKGDGESPSLVSRFLYPRFGFGQIPGAMAERLPAGAVALGTQVVGMTHRGGRITEVAWRRGDEQGRMKPEEVISTMAVTDLVRRLSPAAPGAVVAAAERLRYRDLVIVFLMLNREQVMTDQWMYFPDEAIFIGRIHEPKNWSGAMSPEGKTSLVVEVFCYRGDEVWEESDASVTGRVVRQLVDLGMIAESEHAGGMVVRLARAYPLYVGTYRDDLDTVMGYLRSFENLQSVGRNGLFRYTSGDYYMEMGMKAAENVMGHEHDLSAVAAERRYAET